MGHHYEEKLARLRSFQLHAKQAKAKLGVAERRRMDCEGLPAVRTCKPTRSHERFFTEQRSDSWPWEKVTPAPVWINWEGEWLETSWLKEAIAQDQERPLQTMTRTKQAGQQCKKNTLKEPVMYLCLHKYYTEGTQITEEGCSILHLPTSTSLRRPTGQGASSLGLFCPRESLYSLQTAQSPILDSPLWEAKAAGRLLQLQYPWPHGSLCNAYCWFGSKAKQSMPSQLSVHCHSCPSSKEAGSIFLETMMS